MDYVSHSLQLQSSTVTTIQQRYNFSLSFELLNPYAYLYYASLQGGAQTLTDYLKSLEKQTLQNHLSSWHLLLLKVPEYEICKLLCSKDEVPRGFRSECFLISGNRIHTA